MEHIEVDVKKLNCDIYSFSGHKVFAGQGIGVSYIKKDVQQKLKLIYSGGGSVVEKNLDNYVHFDFIETLESGTRNYVGILSLESAIDFIQDIDEVSIQSYLTELTQYLLAELKKIKSIQFSKGPVHWQCYDGFGTISFRHIDIDSSSIGFILDQENICVRTGDHYSLESEDDYVRVSLHIYNTKEDIDRLVSMLSAL